jgi:hypothetical protein
MGRRSLPADRGHLSALRALRAAGLDPVVISIEPNRGREARTDDERPGESSEPRPDQSRLFA